MFFKNKYLQIIAILTAVLMLLAPGVASAQKWSSVSI